jgi:hypothetical protein
MRRPRLDLTGQRFDRLVDQWHAGLTLSKSA